jgi:hypothetical protein
VGRHTSNRSRSGTKARRDKGASSHFTITVANCWKARGSIGCAYQRMFQCAKFWSATAYSLKTSSFFLSHAQFT